MAGTQPVDSAFTGGVLHLVPLDGTAVTATSHMLPYRTLP